MKLIKCIKVIVNRAEGIKYSFFEQIQDEKIIHAQVIIRLSDNITVSCLCVR